MKTQVQKFIHDRGFNADYSGKDKTMYLNCFGTRRISKELKLLNATEIIEKCERVIKETKKQFPNRSFKITY